MVSKFVTNGRNMTSRKAPRPFQTSQHCQVHPLCSSKTLSTGLSCGRNATREFLRVLDESGAFLEPWEFPSMDTQLLYGLQWKIKNVPNHQPAINGGFHKWGYPNSWMVYKLFIREHPTQKWMRTGGSPIYGKPHSGVHLCHFPTNSNGWRVGA